MQSSRQRRVLRVQLNQIVIDGNVRWLFTAGVLLISDKFELSRWRWRERGFRMRQGEGQFHGQIPTVHNRRHAAVERSNGELPAHGHDEFNFDFVLHDNSEIFFLRRTSNSTPARERSCVVPPSLSLTSSTKPSSCLHA